MTGRERLTAVSRGGEVDTKPSLAWFTGELDIQADGWIVDSPSKIAEARQISESGCVITAVRSPFGWAKKVGLDLMSELSQSPIEGGDKLAEMAEKSRSEIREALDEGADGFCYLLAGADPTETTPMQYGGFLLELDREILAEFSGTVFNAVWVTADSEPYLEFVADLPCHALGWNSSTTGIHTHSIRPYREGAFFGDSPESDIQLLNFPSVSNFFAASQEASC